MIKKLKEVFVFGNSTVPALVVLLVGLLFFFGAVTPYFFTFSNFRSIVGNLPVYAIMAVGLSFVLLVGGLDISIGSILGFTAINVVLFHKLGFPIYAVVASSLSIGILLGSVNALIIIKIGVNPVITTLGMMAFARGLASWFALNFEVLKVRKIFDHNFLMLARFYLPNSEMPIIPITLIYIIVIYGVASYVLKFTRYGRSVYAVGSNEYAARLAGINTTKIKFLSYLISGAAAAFAAVISVAQLSIGTDKTGDGAELEVITAVVLGGVSLSGGKGSLLGVFLAVLILGVIRNGMVHLEGVAGISYHWRIVVRGAVLILAITIDAIRTKTLKKRQRVRQ